MNTIIRYLTITVFGGGAVALLGLAGEARACPVAEQAQLDFKPYICNVVQPAGGSTQNVTWRVTFSEPVDGVSWNDFLLEETYEVVSPEIASNPGRRYGLGTVWLEYKKISSTVYDISIRWDCEASDNDCSHNEDFIPNWVVGARQDRYEGDVWLEVASDAEFIEIRTPASTISHAHVDLTARVAVW